MRFGVAMFDDAATVLPRWALALKDRLKYSGELAPPETLGPVTALRELCAAGGSAIAGRPMRAPEDRQSLRDDLRRAWEAIGPRTAAAAAPGLAPIRADLGDVPDWLADPSGAARAVAVAQATLAALANADICRAAWEDLQAAAEGAATAGEIELRIRQLSELVEGRGGDWRSTAQRIESILSDDRDVMAALGVIDPPQEPPENVQARQMPAGVSLERRLDLAREATAVEAPRGHLVAWVCFANASLGSWHRHVGSVEFFGHQLWPEGIARGWANSREHTEFDDEWHKLLFISMPEEPFVVVRIPLGHGQLTGASDRARRIAADVIRAAHPHSEWRLIDGAAIHVDGEEGGWFGQPLHARARRELPRYSPEFEPTADRLASMEAKLVDKLLEGDVAAHGAVRDIEWAENVSRVADEPQRLALSTRLIERTLPATGKEHWTAPVRRYFKEAWAEQMTRNFVVDAAHGVVDVLDSVMSMDNANNGWRHRLTPDDSGRGYSVDLAETMRTASEQVRELPDGSLQRRVAAELESHVQDAQSWLRFLGAADAQFDILISRLVRQRNAVLHGADTVPAVIASVTDFAGYLQSFVTSHQLNAAQDDATLLALLEENRIRLSDVRARLAAGESPETAIFKRNC